MLFKPFLFVWPSDNPQSQSTFDPWLTFSARRQSVQPWVWPLHQKYKQKVHFFYIMMTFNNKNVQISNDFLNVNSFNKTVGLPAGYLIFNLSSSCFSISCNKIFSDKTMKNKNKILHVC